MLENTFDTCLRSVEMQLSAPETPSGHARRKLNEKSIFSTDEENGYF